MNHQYRHVKTSPPRCDEVAQLLEVVQREGLITGYTCDGVQATFAINGETIELKYSEAAKFALFLLDQRTRYYGGTWRHLE